jgi:hypothetical protein
MSLESKVIAVLMAEHQRLGVDSILPYDVAVLVAKQFQEDVSRVSQKNLHTNWLVIAMFLASFGISPLHVTHSYSNYIEVSMHLGFIIFTVIHSITTMNTEARSFIITAVISYVLSSVLLHASINQHLPLNWFSFLIATTKVFAHVMIE